MTKKREKKIEQKRLLEATKNLKEIQEKLAPFVRKTRQINISTAGEWQDNVAWIGKESDLTGS